MVIITQKQTKAKNETVADIISIIIKSTSTQVNSALHPFRVAKSSTSFGLGRGGKTISAGW